MILNGLQTEILNTDNEHNIVACGRGAGTTTGLILRAMKDTRDKPLVLFVCPSQYQALQCFGKVQQMAVLGGWRFSMNSYIATNTDTGGKIKFTSEQSYADILGTPEEALVVIDHIDYLPLEIAWIYLTVAKNTVVSADPLPLGRRYKGWDIPLIRKDCQEKETFNYSDYKSNVSVVRGYSVTGNPALRSNTEYLKALSGK